MAVNSLKSNTPSPDSSTDSIIRSQSRSETSMPSDLSATLSSLTSSVPALSMSNASKAALSSAVERPPIERSRAAAIASRAPVRATPVANAPA